MNRLKDCDSRLASNSKDASSPVSPSFLRIKSRGGQTNPVVIVLLTLIFVAIVALTVVIVINSGGVKPVPTPRTELAATPEPASKTIAVADGQTFKRDQLPVQPSPPPKAIANPDRIKETLKAGRTYRVVLKSGFQSRVEDSEWGLSKIVNLTFAAEHEIIRKIESNDGTRIVELRHFARARAVKVLSEVEQSKIDLGLPGILILGALESYLPGVTGTVAMTMPILEAVLHQGTNIYMKAEDAKVVASIDSLSGKQVRIEYVDGGGVQSITPVGCTLNEDERGFVFATATLSDCYLLPELTKKEGESWSVEGSQFAFLIDPTWRGQPMGSVTLIRDRNQVVNGQPHAFLKVGNGLVTINATDQSKSRKGTFTPSGHMTFALTDGYIDSARLEGKLTIEEMSRDHLLFPTIFKAMPTVTMDYSCQIQP